VSLDLIVMRGDVCGAPRSLKKFVKSMLAADAA
jgi:hypothetical protein